MSLKLPTYFEYTNPDAQRGSPYSQTESHKDYNHRGEYLVGEVITFKDEKDRWVHEILEVSEGIPPDETKRHWIVKLGPVIPNA